MNRLFMFVFALCTLLFLSFTGGCEGRASSTLYANKYVITTTGELPSERWGEALYHQLSRRCSSSISVFYTADASQADQGSDVKQIVIDVRSDLGHDLEVENTRNRITLRVPSDKNALWAVYQLIAALSEEDARISAPDLPPAIAGFADGSTMDFAFEYREPFFLPNVDSDISGILATHSIDRDWGIWGHNLANITEDNLPLEAYAWVNGRPNKEQFCFSSPELYSFIEEYIIDNFGEGDLTPTRFMLLPQDNDLVCTRHCCVALGNTEDNGTPALVHLLTRLAKRFSSHTFYTGAYRTTSYPPTEPLPKNVGVFLSTIDLPKGVDLKGRDSKETQNFISQLEDWRKVTSNIYLWDYVANYDDYLTPHPILLAVQQQMQYFHELGVKGLFLHGTGYDYSPFQGLKSFVLSALMLDPTMDVPSLVHRYLARLYPISHHVVYDYYMGLEKAYQQRNRPYNLYGGMHDNLSTYFTADGFESFYEYLPSLMRETSGEERRMLHRLHIGLSFAYLQLCYETGRHFTPEAGFLYPDKTISEALAVLETPSYREGFNHYRETAGHLNNYTSRWRELIANRDHYHNRLLYRTLEGGSPDDEQPLSLLTNGLPGFDNDYHQGWYLTTAGQLKVAISLDAPEREIGSLRLRFLNMPEHRILPPSRVEVWVDGQRVAEQAVAQGGAASVVLSLPLPRRINERMEVRITNSSSANSRPNTIACDEIQLL